MKSSFFSFQEHIANISNIFVKSNVEQRRYKASMSVSTEQLQPHGSHIPRRQCIPVLYTKGTHYDVGFDMVCKVLNSHTFRGIYLMKWFWLIAIFQSKLSSLLCEIIWRLLSTELRIFLEISKAKTFWIVPSLSKLKIVKSKLN